MTDLPARQSINPTDQLIIYQQPNDLLLANQPGVTVPAAPTAWAALLGAMGYQHIGERPNKIIQPCHENIDANADAMRRLMPC